MPLATSGALSMSAIHVEAEGSPYAHSSIVSLNDTNVRGLTPASGYTINSTADTTISIGDFYGASSAVAMSTTNNARLSSSGNTTYVNRSVTSGIVFINLIQDFRLRRQDNFVYYETKTQFPGTWYNTSGTGSSLGSTYVTLGTFNLGGITSIKMDWSVSSTGTGGASISGNTSGTSATYSASDNSFQTVSNGQSIGARFVVTASAECYNSNIKLGTATMTLTAQKTGYLDTTLGAYKHQMRAAATSNNCF